MSRKEEQKCGFLRYKKKFDQKNNVFYISTIVQNKQYFVYKINISPQNSFLFGNIFTVSA